MDISSNIILKDGQPHLNFGKDLGKPMEWVVLNNTDYLI